jgi:AbrB family looped-hinge helix DNA binding protein
MATNLTSKGHVTVPKKVHEYLGLKPGEAVTFERVANGDIVLRPDEPAAEPTEPWRSFLRELDACLTGHEVPPVLNATHPVPMG